MALPPPRDHEIDLARAKALVQKRRANRPRGAVRGGGFDKGAIQKLISQPGCVAMRFYLAEHDDGSEAIVLVGVDENGQDLASGVLLNDHWLCPPWCPDNSPLNE